MANNILYQNLSGMEEAYFASAAGLPQFNAAAALGQHDDPNLAGVFASSELNDPEYSTDDFRMFSFKVARCSKRYVHDWRSCPFAHPTENARRRDPRTARYLPVPCPDYKRGICMRGDTCPYSHGVYECWLHPAKYRTQLCKEGPACRRPVCFFAHTVQNLRQPTYLWGDLLNAESGDAATAAAALMQQSGGVIEAKRTESDAARTLQSAAEEAFNNMEEQSVPLPTIKSSGGPPSLPAQDSPPRSPLSAAGGNGGNPSRPSSPTVVDNPHPVANSASSDSVTEAGSQSSGNSGETTSTTTQNNSAANDETPRMSLDSNMQMRAASAVATAGPPSWSAGLAASATAAAALAGVPVNEQPMLSNHGPRMSNAVARKLGLAPTKPPSMEGIRTTTAAPATTTGLGTLGSPQRHTMDIHSQSFQTNTALEEVRLSQAALAAQLGVGMNYTGTAAAIPTTNGGGFVNSTAVNYSSSYPGADTLGIHPALLNLVAANMATNNGGGGNQSVYSQQQQQQLFAFAQQAGQQHSNDPLLSSSSTNPGMEDSASGIATLLGQMNHWGLSDSDSLTQEDSSAHSSNRTFNHRASSDGFIGSSGVVAPHQGGMQQQQQQQQQQNYLFSLDVNNQAGMSSSDC